MEMLKVCSCSNDHVSDDDDDDEGKCKAFIVGELSVLLLCGWVELYVFFFTVNENTPSKIYGFLCWDLCVNVRIR